MEQSNNNISKDNKVSDNQDLASKQGNEVEHGHLINVNTLMAERSSGSLFAPPSSAN